MGDADVPVQWWTLTGPGPRPAPEPADRGSGGSAALRRLVADSGITVLGIAGLADRDQARLAIREIIAAALVQLTGLPPERIVLHAEPGEAPFALLDTPGGRRKAWLAISHDGELSLAAISLCGRVGIDVTQIAGAEAFPDWEPVARDYLGPEVAAALAPLSPTARVAAFARAWTEREARLKYLGRELVEWSADGDAALGVCRCLPLALPDAYAGALAVPA